MSKAITAEIIAAEILEFRGKKVMLDRDLAPLCGGTPKVLNQAVKRNIKRFPADFMFQLDKKEMENWKSQIVISNSEKMGLRKQPLVFTEGGVAMLSGVLNSDRAINVNIQIIRTFIKIRELLATNEAIQRKVMELEKKYGRHNDKIKKIFYILGLLQTDENKKEIGFK